MKSKPPVVDWGAPCTPTKFTFKDKLALRFMHIQFQWEVWAGYIAPNGEPLRCTNCDSWHNDHHKWRTVDTINGQCAEGELSCTLCGNVMGYWAYGYWEPPFQF